MGLVDTSLERYWDIRNAYIEYFSDNVSTFIAIFSQKLWRYKILMTWRSQIISKVSGKLLLTILKLLCKLGVISSRISYFMAIFVIPSEFFTRGGGTQSASGNRVNMSWHHHQSERLSVWGSGKKNNRTSCIHGYNSKNHWGVNQ